MRPRTLCYVGLVVVSVGLAVHEAAGSEWTRAAWNLAAAGLFAFIAARPPEWWDALGHRIADRLGL